MILKIAVYLSRCRASSVEPRGELAGIDIGELYAAALAGRSRANIHPISHVGRGLNKVGEIWNTGKTNHYLAAGNSDMTIASCWI